MHKHSAGLDVYADFRIKNLPLECGVCVYSVSIICIEEKKNKKKEEKTLHIRELSCPGGTSSEMSTVKLARQH